MLSTLARFPKFEKGIGIVKPWLPSTERRIGEKLGRSEFPGRSKEKSTNSPFRICSSSLFGKLGLMSNGEDVDGCHERSRAACCVLHGKTWQRRWLRWYCLAATHFVGPKRCGEEEQGSTQVSGGIRMSIPVLSWVSDRHLTQLGLLLHHDRRGDEEAYHTNQKV